MDARFYERLNGWPAIIIGVAVILGVSYGASYTFNNLETEKALVLAELEQEREENYQLILNVRERQGIINAFSGQISSITSTVGTLEKLAATDEELLKKYSKVYFLNENYVPSKLTDISKGYRVGTATNYLIQVDVWPHLERLLKAARGDGIELLVASAFRSFDTQSSLKSGYTFTYGSGANSFSADQGYSEHQLGTAVDFTTKKLGVNFTQFASDPAYEWLKERAHNYGFVLSYPEKNSYYKFEPWHWRYVGRELAFKLYEEGKFFYDLDQRVIDTYLIKLFD